jgi:hypothetical protein
MKNLIDPEVDPAINSAFVEPPFVPMSVSAARESEGLVWWRPDGVISETPDSDVAMVRLG